MKRTACLLLLLCVSALLPAAQAEEERGPRCGLYAVVDEGDGGMLRIYDGLRKGLELAQLPRVCREAAGASAQVRAAFLERVRARKQLPVFAVGDASVRYLAGPMPEITRVFALERYTAGGRPLLDLPVWDRLAIVYAARPAERVGEILRRLTGKKEVRVHLSQFEHKDLQKTALRLGKAAGIRLVSAEGKGLQPDVVLHLRLAGRAPPLSFAAALALARRLKIALVSDDRGRFGQGAVLTLVGRHRLVGKAAAEVARRLRLNPNLKIPPYGLPGIDVWVDLGAADAQGVRLPLPFLARADRLVGGKRKRAK